MPNPFLEIRVDRLTPEPALIGACAGYEGGRWRCRELARHTLQWLPEFALKYSEWRDLTADDAVVKVAESARAVYESAKFQRRGEFGEILLHLLLRQHIGTLPAISKIYFKDSRNDRVKGFDAVHVLEVDDGLELWLGEVKFYKDLGDAIRDVTAELQAHSQIDFLRDEFVAIRNKLDGEWAHAESLRALVARERSMDEVFTRLCIPVLLTYESPAVGSHIEVSEAYVTEFTTELESAWESFSEKLPEIPVRVCLFLLPIADKATLVNEMHDGLRHAQELI